MVVTDTGDYISDKIKIYACPNDGQEIFGGGDYKIFSNNVPNPYLCIPIYLGVNGSNGTYPYLTQTNWRSGHIYRTRVRSSGSGRRTRQLWRSYDLEHGIRSAFRDTDLGWTGSGTSWSSGTRTYSATATATGTTTDISSTCSSSATRARTAAGTVSSTISCPSPSTGSGTTPSTSRL